MANMVRQAPAQRAPAQQAPEQEAPAPEAPAQQAPPAAAPSEGQGMTREEYAQLGMVPNPLAVPAKMTYSQYPGQLSPTTVAAIERIHGRSQGSQE